MNYYKRFCPSLSQEFLGQIFINLSHNVSDMRVKDLLKLLKKGEGVKIEFKRKFTKEILKDICAMANSEGGYIIIGVDDEGNIVGCNKRMSNRIMTSIKDLIPIPKIKIHSMNLDGKDVVILEVERSERIVTIGGLAYVRIGTGKRVLSVEELLTEFSERNLIFFDSLLSNVPFDDIKEEYLEWYFEKRKEVRGTERFGEIEKDVVASKIALKKDGKLFLTNAGVLFFLENPQDYFPQSTLRVIFLDENMETKRIREFTGPVWKQARDSFDFLISSLGSITIRRGVEKVVLPEYPEEALREAIINAVTHRNYLLHADIRILVFPNKIIVRSPGGFPPGFRIENPEHIPRNPLISKFMYEIGEIERYGFGIPKILESCKRHGFVQVRFDSTSYKLDVVFEKMPFDLDEIDRLIISRIRMGKDIREIAREIKISKSTVHRRIKKMMERGLVRKVGRRYVVP